MTTTETPDCRWCKWMHWPWRTCEAFPGGIPKAMYYGGETHYAPVAGDGGRVFEAASDEVLAARGYGPYPPERVRARKLRALYEMEKSIAAFEFGELLCTSCEHYGPDPGRCAAFPQGLPIAIVSGAIEHRESLAGDGGLTYKRRPESAAAI